MTLIRRRAILLWGGSLAVVATFAAFFGRQALEDQQRLRAAQADYLAGRVSIVDGWIVAESEARGQPSRQP